MKELFNMAGMDLPKYFGEEIDKRLKAEEDLKEAEAEVQDAE